MTEMTDTTATPRGERTREATDRKLMRATLQIAVDRGISGVTIEEVARRSGVAKTTIYRRYHNADELLHEISAMYLAIPDSDPVPSPTREHFTQLLQRLVDWVFREDVDEKLLLSTIIGSLVAYEAIEGKAMDDDTAWASRMADLLWPALLK